MQCLLLLRLCVCVRVDDRQAERMRGTYTHTTDAERPTFICIFNHFLQLQEVRMLNFQMGAEFLQKHTDDRIIRIIQT